MIHWIYHAVHKTIWFLALTRLGLWLLITCWFEDTSDWTADRLTLLKRSFAVVMLVILLASALYTFAALAQGGMDPYVEKRLERVEARQDRNFDEHRDMERRITMVEGNTQHMDRLIYGVIGLTCAVIGQWLLALLKFKMDRDFHPQRARVITDD